jgi:(S)-2-hydroxy-acid oxidase
MALVCLEDYEREAQYVLPWGHHNYYAKGACLMNTVRDNSEAYKRYKILPKVLRDVSQVDTSVNILGKKISFPVGISPTALHGLAHVDGEMSTSKGCVRAGTCMIQSIFSSKSIEEVTEGCGRQGLRWMQVQPLRDRSIAADIVSRAETNGYKAIVMTCDNPQIYVHDYHQDDHPNKIDRYIPGNYPKEIIDSVYNSKTTQPNLIKKINETIFEPAQTWEWVDWLRSITSLPIVLKGILRPDDAIEAIKHDIQGILVSNHGGRIIDDVPATIDVLSEIVEAVDGKVDVYVDGGIRHGTDVFKALALGAKAVFVGRPVIWGLACKGEDGVYDVLDILKREFHSAMVFSGCSKVADITPDYVKHASYYTHPTLR